MGIGGRGERDGSGPGSPGRAWKGGLLPASVSWRVVAWSELAAQLRRELRGELRGDLFEEPVELASGGTKEGIKL